MTGDDNGEMERLLTVLLGARIPPPEGIPQDTIPRGVVFRRGGFIPRIGGILGRMSGPAAAVTLGRTIVVCPGVRLSPSLLAHELTHVRQWREDPWFPVRYCLKTLRHGYFNNPYEVEARECSASVTQPLDKRDD